MSRQRPGVGFGTFIGIIRVIMNLFVYMPRPGPMGGRLLDEIVHLSVPGSMEVFSDIRNLAARMKLPKEPESVAIVHDPTHEDLQSLAALKDYLRGTRILLILPDQAEETIFLAHKLFPSFITYIDNGVSGVVSILRQLAKGGRGKPIL